MRTAGAMLGVLLLVAVPAAAQTAVPVAGAAKPQAPVPEGGTKRWEFSATAFGYFLPDALDTNDFVLPTFSADRGRLHLEGRYNYEGIGTGSAWIGVNFSGGTRVTWSLTPMVGAVFGTTDGVAPGYRGSLAWRKLELTSEGEWVFDAHDSADNFLYNWSEFTYAAADWVRFGVAAQRTRTYETGHDIQRGLVVAFTWKWLDIAGYVFNPDDTRPIVLVAVNVSF